jgi:magnesium chelatase subunit D
VTETRVVCAGRPFEVRNVVVREGEVRSDVRGRRQRVVSRDRSGAYTRAVLPRGRVTDPAVDATLRTAAARQRGRTVPAGRRVAVLGSDLRQKLRTRRAGCTIMFVVDASGSMHQRQRMREAKTAVLSLLADAYRKRDRVGLVSFRDRRAELVLPLTGSIELARRRLADLASGGRTPLAEGLRLARETLERERSRRRESISLMVVLSDGKTNVARSGDPVGEALAEARAIARSGIGLLFLDTDMTWEDPGLGMKLCDEAGGRYVGAGALDARRIVEALTVHAL